MRLTRLTIQDFLGIRRAEIDLAQAPLHIFMGPNNSGKSSVCDAVEFALTGLARAMAKKKDAGTFLRRRGAEHFAVELAWEGGQLRRTDSGCSLAERDVAAIFGDESIVRASLSGFRFLASPPSTRRELVAGVTGKKADLGAALAKVCKEAGLPADLTEKLVKMADEDIDHAETFAVEQRKAAKRSLEAYTEGDPPPGKVTIDGKEYDLTKTDWLAIEKRLAERKAERDNALRAEGEAKLLDAPEAISAKIAALKDEIAKIPAAAAAGKADADAKKALAAMTAAEIELGRAQGALEAARKNAENIDKLGALGKCPTCRQAIDQSFVAKMYDEAVSDGDKCNEAVEQAKAKLAGLRKANDDAQAAAKAAQVGAGKASELNARLKGLEDDLADAMAYPKLAAESARLTAAVELGEKLLQAAQRYSAWQVRAKNEEGIKHSVAVWDKIAKALGKEGEIRKMTSTGFDLSVVRSAAAALLGPDRTVDVDESWNITCGGLLGPGLSRSERLRLGAGFATAFAIASKLGVAVIDEVDILQAKNRKALTGWLLGQADKVGTFILGSTRDERPASGSGDPRVKFWWCENGEVVGL